VLEIDVPSPHEPGTLARKLGEQWPSYAAYVVSFATIGVIWINHHAMLRRWKAVDHSVLVLNLLLLLLIGVLPWTTALFAEYLRESDGQHLAAAIYAGSFLAMALAFFVMQRHVLLSKPHLLADEIGPEQQVAVVRRNTVGLLPYMIAVAAAPVSSYLVLVICAAVAVFYALPATTR
jgi:uncharacterized membrane protein